MRKATQGIVDAWVAGSEAFGPSVPATGAVMNGGESVRGVPRIRTDGTRLWSYRLLIARIDRKRKKAYVVDSDVYASQTNTTRSHISAATLLAERAGFTLVRQAVVK